MSQALIGVSTFDLPTIKASGISGAALNRAGLIGKFERGPRKPVQITSYPQAVQRFGDKVSSFYGMYCLETLFATLDGVSATLDIRRAIADGALAATLAVNNIDTVPAPVLNIFAGQYGEKDPGTWANSLLGYLILNSNRFISKITATATAVDVIKVEAAAQYAVGDNLLIGASTKVKVLSVDELNSTLKVSANVTAAINDAVKVVDRTIKVYRKDSVSGLITLVETLSNLTTNPESAYYILLVANSTVTGSRYLTFEHLTTAAAGAYNDLPAVVVDDIANISWLTGGTNGTALTDDEEVAFASEFSEGILVAHTDKITEAFNQKLEAALYNNGEGMKVAVLTVPLSTAQDTDLAKAFINRQRISRRYHGLYNQTWLSVDDPKGLGPNAKKTIPPIGAVMGYWIQEVVRRGFHRVPASRKKGILGIRGLIGEVTNRVTLTELADLGMNNITGDENGGFFIRSARTPSKEKEFTFVNAVFMSVYFKRTFQNDETIAGLENETDTVAIMRALKNSMQGFALLVYRSSTNGGVESGLASYVKPDGSLTTFNDVCRIVVDESINSIDDVTSGIVKGNFYFMAPSPAERILIGVGLLFTL